MNTIIRIDTLRQKGYWIERLMRKRNTVILLFILFIAVAGCTSPEDSSEPEQSETVSGTSFSMVGPRTHNFSSDGGSFQVSFTSSHGWTIDLTDSRVEDWFDVSPKSGTGGNGLVTFTAQPNTTYDERRAVVTLKAGNIEETFYIVQKQKDALLVTSDKVEMGKEGGEMTVEVQSNIEYSCRIDESAQSWISRTETRGLTSHSEVFTVAANTEVLKREGTITFYQGDKSETVTVFQEGEDPVMLLTMNRYEVEAEGETLQIEIQSNTEYEMRLPSVDWIEEANTRSLSSHTHYIIVHPNDTYNERSTSISFVDKVTYRTEEVSILQKQKDALLVTSDKVEMGKEGGEMTVEVQSNIEYSCRIDESAQSWISRTETRGLTSHSEVFTVAANTEVLKREGTITFYQGDKSETVTVYQEGEDPVMVLTKNRYEVEAEGETLQIEIQSNTDYEMRLPSVDWIEEANTRSLSSHTHYIIVHPNDTYNERSTSISFVDKVTNRTEEVSIVQKQKETPVFEISKKTYELDEQGGTIHIEVQTNVDYEMALPSVDWIAEEATRAVSAQSRYISVAPNDTYDKRIADITFTCPEAEKTFVVRVIQRQHDGFFVSPDHVEISYKGGEVSVKVQSNTEYDWTVEEGARAWITHTNTRGLSSDELIFSVTENLFLQKREGKITFTSGGSSTVVVITQSGSEANNGGIADMPTYNW